MGTSKRLMPGSMLPPVGRAGARRGGAPQFAPHRLRRLPGPPCALGGGRAGSDLRLRHRLIGYARVSKTDDSQSLDLQRDAPAGRGHRGRGQDPHARRLARRQPDPPGEPAAAVRGPKHVVTKGAPPVLSPAEAKKLLETIDTGAVLGMRRQDYFGQGNRGWLRLHEKGGKRHDVPAHHRAAAALDAYVEAAGFEEPKAALFQSMDPAGRRLTGRALDRRLVLAMIKRRAVVAGLPPSTCCHTFRATGITAYLSKEEPSSTRSRSRGTRLRRRRSSTTGRRTR